MAYFETLFLKNKRPYFWLLGIILLVYFQTLTFDFSYFDDNVLILKNLSYLKKPAFILEAFKTQVFYILHSQAAYYRPLLTLSFMLDAFISGGSAWGYHLSNLVIHLLVTLFLFRFLLVLDYSRISAFLASLFFAIHPALVMAVAWIPGRNDSLISLFTLVSFIFLCRFLSTKNYLAFILHSFSFLLALLTKETALLLVPLFVFFTFLKQASLKKNSYKLFYLSISWLICIGVWWILREKAFSEEERLVYSFLEIVRSTTRNLPALFLHLGKIFFPFNLSVLPILKDSTLIYGLLSFGLLSTFIIFLRPRFLITIFGASWYFLLLISSFVRPDSEQIADFLEHRQYLPLVGLVIIILELFRAFQLRWGEEFSNFRDSEKLPWTFLILFLWLVVLMSLNLFYQNSFKNRITFWEKAVRSAPSHPLAHRNLGAMYFLDDHLAEAEKEFLEALRLNPSEQMAHNNLGLIYYKRGNFQKAEEEYLEELKINPNYDDVHFNLGLLYYQLNKIAEAKKYWQKTILLNPDYIDAYINLIILFLNNNELPQAKEYYLKLKARGLENSLSPGIKEKLSRI